jgi:2'-5' RNA ligase
MRLFVALEIPRDIRTALTAVVDDFRTLDSRNKSRPRWTRPENLHITLKFIGHVPPDKLDSICAALSTVRSSQSVELQFHSVGFFPNEKRARILWGAVSASTNLGPLAAQVERALEPFGIQPEMRPFTPHLTLARFDPPGIAPDLRAKIANYTNNAFGAVITNQFHLFQSVLKPSGAEYTILRSFVFSPEA